MNCDNADNGILFSVVIANYNYGRFLEEAIQSVLSQSCQNFELIIVDGGSTDNSVEVIRKYTHGLPPNTQRANVQQPIAKISWWVSEKDKGQSDAFNKGFAHARGRFLTWLNADDIMLPGTIENVSRLIAEKPDVQWIVGSTVWCDENWNIVKVFRAHKFSRIRAYAGLITASGPSSFFLKELYDSVGGCDEELHYVMDTDLWSKFIFLKGCRYERITNYVWGYRIHAESKMSGPTVEPDSEISVKKRARLFRERSILQERYGARSRCYGFLSRLPASFVDLLISLWRQFRYRGKSINYLCRSSAVPVNILISNGILEYMIGCSRFAKKVFAFNTWRRKRFDSRGNLIMLDDALQNDVKGVAGFVDRYGIAVLYAQGARSLLFFSKVAHTCRACRPKILVTAHSGYLWRSLMRSLAFILLARIFADDIVFISSRTLHEWKWLLRLFQMRAYHVPNPVDISRFDDVYRIRQRAKQDMSMITLGMIGVITPAKGQMILIKAVEKLVAMGCNIRCRIAGDVKSTSYMQELVKYVSQVGLEDRISFDGLIPYDDVPRWMASLDIYCCSSECEVMPFSILEAMAAGVPIVAHDVGAINEQVREGENGFLVRSNCAADYALAIKKIIDGGLMLKYGDTSRCLATSYFSFESFAARMKLALSGC